MNKNLFYTIVAFLLFIYLSPLFLNDFKCLVGDNLNSNVAINKILVDNDALFVDSKQTVPYIMGGIERGYFKSELNFSVLSYKFFDYKNAYRINKILMSLVAFFGMFFLLNRFIFKNTNTEINCLIALGFSTLPFYPNAFLTISGQPLLLFCYLNILNKRERIYDWIIIGVFPFSSSLVLGNLFFHFFFFFFLLLFCLKKMNYKIIIAFLIFAIMSLISEYRLFNLFFLSDLDSFRSTILKIGTLNFKGVIGTTFLFFIDGHRHFSSMHFPFIFLVIFSSIFFLRKSYSTEFFKIFIFLFFAIIFCSFFDKLFYGWEKLNFLKTKNNFINSFTLRFYSILPICWYLLLAISSYFIFKIEKFKTLLYFFLALVVANNFFGTYNKSVENIFLHTYFKSTSNTHFTMNNYYSPTFFNSLKKELNISKSDKVLSYGFPSIILNNVGISTVGGFNNNFPIKKKKQISLILEKELNKNIQFKNWFENNGVYCEAQSSLLFKNQKLKKEHNVDLNLEALKKTGCNYIFSNLLIENINSKPVKSLVVRKNKINSYLKEIYIYKI